MNQKVGRKQVIFGALFALILLPLIGFTVFLFTRPQNIAPKAASPALPTPISASVSPFNTSSNYNGSIQQLCNPPGPVQNVKVNYPNCQ